MDMLKSRMIWTKAKWKLGKGPTITVVENEKSIWAKTEK